MGAGASYSYLDEEKITWNHHCLLFDEDTRENNLGLIDYCFPDDSEIKLCKADESNGGLDYQQFFISGRTEANIVELSGRRSTTSNSSGFYSINRVQCNSIPYDKYEIVEVTKMTPAIKERIVQIMGMCSYSLCLRNSEHVANFIFHGTWASLQMEDGGVLSSYFKSKMTDDQQKKINIFPSSIPPKNVSDGSCERLYSFIDKQYTPTAFQYFSNGNNTTYNILVAGPTGAGKSRLINVLFNSTICDSIASHQSVTRDVCFIEGKAEIFNLETSEMNMKKVIVADTVGLCDTEWDDDKVFSLLKGRVSRNFASINAVFVVFRADRLLKEHVENITKLMDWLNYNDHHLNFLFVGTCAENLTDDDKKRLKLQAKKMLNLKETKTPESDYESLVYVGFPQENQLNDLGKAQVKASWELLQPLMRLNENSKPLVSYKVHVKNEKWWSSFIKLPKLPSSCTIL